MAPLTDPIRLEAYKDALSNWRFDGFIQFDLTDTSYRWIKRELSNITLKGIGHLMYEHVAAGGEVDEVRETRAEWSDEYKYHYDLRISIQGQPVYIETRLDCPSPFVHDESTILVVNVHA